MYNAGMLPFTGLATLPIALIGAALTVAGTLIRKLQH